MSKTSVQSVSLARNFSLCDNAHNLDEVVLVFRSRRSVHCGDCYFNVLRARAPRLASIKTGEERDWEARPYGAGWPGLEANGIVP